MQTMISAGNFTVIKHGCQRWKSGGMAWIYYARREVPIGPRRCLINNLVRFVRDSPSPTYTSSQHFKANLVVLDLMTGLLEGQVLQVFSILFSATEAWSANVEAVLLV